MNIRRQEKRTKEKRKEEKRKGREAKRREGKRSFRSKLTKVGGTAEIRAK
jgi:hypothetical protein